MTDANLVVSNLEELLELEDRTALVFVESSEFEFVGGGAAVANGY